MSDSLFEAFRFPCGAEAPNRVMLAPLTNGQSHDDGTLGDAELAWLARRARGGFGVVTTCAVHVTEDAKGFAGQLGAWGDHQLEGLGRLASTLRAQGGLALVQLFHGGARCPSSLTGAQPWSASAFTEDRPGFEVPRPATEADLARAIDGFADAAARCERAGFDGVELHGAHGYLLSQFLSRTQNTRDDAWGGDLDGRARLLLEVTRRVRAATSPRFLVGVRLSPEDGAFARGLDLDESLEVARRLVDARVDYLHLSLWDCARNTRKRPDTHPLPLFRAAVPASVALVVAGKLWTRAQCEALRAQGADLVALGRAAIVNPDWPALARDPAWEPRRPPLTADELAALDVSPRFVDYLRRFDGMVAG